MYVLILSLLLVVPGCSGEWLLGHSFNFDHNHFDKTKWYLENETESCSGQVLDCSVDSPETVRQTDGSLVLSAVRRRHLNKQYITPWIRTNQSVLSFEWPFQWVMRAALPKAKMVHTRVMLMARSDDGSIQGTVTLNDYQTNDLEIGFKTLYDLPGSFTKHQVQNKYLGDFHVYSVQWNKTSLVWKVDEDVIHWVTAEDNYERSLQTYKLYLSLDVGDVSLFPGQTLTPTDADNWNCSSLIIDYMHTYYWNSNQTITKWPSVNHGNSSPRSICAKVKADNKQVQIGTVRKTTSNLIITTVVLCILFVLLILVVGFIIIRKAKQRNAELGENGYDDVEVYEQAKIDDHDYSEVNYANNYETHIVHDYVVLECDRGKQNHQDLGNNVDDYVKMAEQI